MCERCIDTCIGICRACCLPMPPKMGYLLQFLIYVFFQGFVIATNIGVVFELSTAYKTCNSMRYVVDANGTFKERENAAIFCQSDYKLTTLDLIPHLRRIEVLEWVFLLLVLIGGTMYIVHIVVLLPNLCKHFTIDNFELELESQPKYYQNILLIHIKAMFVETLVHGVPFTCLATEFVLLFFGEKDLTCWECAATPNAVQKEKSISNTSLWMALILSSFGLVNLYKGVLPLYEFLGNPFCWSCYALRIFISMPGGFLYSLLAFTPAMAVINFRLIPKIPKLKLILGQTADSFWVIGLVFWVLLAIMGLLTWYFWDSLRSFCPCCPDERREKDKNRDKDKKDGKTGCISF